MYDHKDLVQRESRDIISQGYVYINRHTAIRKDLICAWPDKYSKAEYESEQRKLKKEQSLLGRFKKLINV